MFQSSYFREFYISLVNMKNLSLMFHSTFMGTRLPVLCLKATVTRFVIIICYIILTFDINFSCFSVYTSVEKLRTSHDEPRMFPRFVRSPEAQWPHGLTPETVFPKDLNCFFPIIRTVNSGFYPKWHYVVGFFNGNPFCLLLFRNWIVVWCSDKLFA